MQIAHLPERPPSALIARSGVWRPLLLSIAVLLVNAVRSGHALALGAAALSSGVWAPLPVAGAPSAREGATAVWTGSELLIWGGHGQRIQRRAR